MVLEPGVAEDHTLSSEAGDSKKCPFGVSFIMEDYVHHFGDLTSLVRGAVYVVHQYGARDAPDANTFHTNKVLIYKVACSSRVQKHLDRIYLASILQMVTYYL